MKRFLVLFLAVFLMLITVGCGKGSNISEEVITEATMSFRYPAASFSVPLEHLLANCCPDYDISFAKYDEMKSEKLTDEKMKKYEESDYGQYLENAYFATFSGCIMNNPEIPYLVTEYKEILTLLVLFDEDDKLVGHIIIDNCSEIDTCAIIIATDF